ncbi:hypothetical protein [Sulfobacillus harzensis]|uniref:Uncharacterized protein n=1 Tax=Sulfobacillus harzensis TaxID=2729629 RepID=A0A7Y0L761_9FIRM|nr:hypothetical protein [Sulfobacillus harzensis]NMP23996.1 hypothetical protein [Sulfobacillus harzensis]
MKARYFVAIGGVIVVGGVGLVMTQAHPHPVSAPSTVHHHHHQKPKAPPPPKTKAPTKPKPKAPPIPKNAPTIPVSGSAAGSVTASFTAVTHKAPPVALQVVTLPWAKDTQWAVEPLGMSMNGEPSTSPTLWFGEKTGSGRWYWIPTTLPGEPPSALPPAIRESIIMAYSLHLGESGPTDTVGNITWAGLQGKVADPEGWTLSTAPANASPLFQPTVGLTLFQQSYTGQFSGYYGLEAAFDAHNAPAGLHGLVGFVSRMGSLNTIVETPPSLL